MTVTRDQILAWLRGIQEGVIVLDRDNEGMAGAAIEALEHQPEIVPLPDDYLSPNFTLAELTWSDTANAQGIDNTPDAMAVEELTQLALITLEGIRVVLGGVPMQITSGYRCPELNAAIGGASNSAHLSGAAADFIVVGMTPLDICRAIEPHMIELGIDQLIHENESWVHVGRAPLSGPPPRYQCLTIDGGQTVTGIV